MFSSDLIKYLWIRGGVEPGTMFIVPAARVFEVEANLRRRRRQEPDLKWSFLDSLASAWNVVAGARRGVGGGWAGSGDGRLPEVMDASAHLWRDISPAE